MLRRIPALLVGLVLAFATATSAAASDPSSAQEWERSIAERAQERPPAGDGLADPLEVRTGVDPVGDAFWPRGDIVEYGARYDDFVRVGAATALVSSPDSAPWIWGITAHMWEIDVNGDGVEDYLVFFGNPGGGGPIGEVTLPDAVTHVCDGVAWYDAVGGYFVDFAPSCIGAPPSFRYTVFASYDDAGVISVDWAPDVGWAGPITRGAPAPPPPPQVGGVTADDGYWLATMDGQVAAFGDRADHGSLTSLPNLPVVGMASTPTDGGYWLVASDGGIFAFGDAGFHGSTGAIALNQPIVGMAPTPTGLGYWLVASDGGSSPSATRGSTARRARSR
ncbi:MAG: hypothetical protein M5U14_05545 [Acidimicrobiia bacterium]|nr:hypothetical protein [Acidimicrobiia bacterium]